MASRNDDPPRRRPRLQSGQGAVVRFRNGDVVNFSSNDYLAYAADSRLVRAAARAAERYGVGAGSSPTRSGLSPPLQALERDLAAWEGYESALVFRDEHLRDGAVVEALASPSDAVYCDEANRPGLNLACRAPGAAVHGYRHKDLGHLDELLRRHEAPGRFVVSESVFAGEGDLADVAGLLGVVKRHSALLLLDESHATGVLGEHGRGVADGLGHEDSLLKLGSLSNALGAQGGYVCCTRRQVDRVVGRSVLYAESSALAPPLAAAARRSIFLVGTEPDRRRHILALAESLRQRLRGLGLNVGPSATQVVTAEVEDHAGLCRRLADRFLLPLDVPGRLTVHLTAGHTEDDVDRLAGALASG